MKTYTNADLADIIEDEGIGYAVEEYVDPERIEDPKTRAMWISARFQLGELSQRCYSARAALEDE